MKITKQVLISEINSYATSTKLNCWTEFSTTQKDLVQL
jgi:hypothetical protein